MGDLDAQHCCMMLNAESMLLAFPCSSIRCHCGKCNVSISNETWVSCMVRAAACCGKTEYMCGRAHKLIFTAENALSHSPERQASLRSPSSTKIPCTNQVITPVHRPCHHFPNPMAKACHHFQKPCRDSARYQMDPTSTSAFKAPI